MCTRSGPVAQRRRVLCPVILLQGLDDKVVPPAQAEEIVAALDAQGIPHAYVAFEGEGHGFRRADNIERAREVELYFSRGCSDSTRQTTWTRWKSCTRSPCSDLLARQEFRSAESRQCSARLADDPPRLVGSPDQVGDQAHRDLE